MTNETLLLAVRSEALKANLERLKRNLKSVPERLNDLTALAEEVRAARKSVVDVRKANMDLEGLRLRDFPDNAPDIILSAVQQLDLAARKLVSVLDIVDKMQNNCFQLVATPIGGDIVDNLATRMVKVDGHLAGLQSLDGASDMKLCWERFRVKATPDAEAIFTDYIELLGGVALRDIGFDEKTSLLADQLLGAAGGKLLALPARQQALVKTFERIIRVTFPDWSLWALPSAALEFWNVAGSQNSTVALEASLGLLAPAERAEIPAEQKRCLGDAYATYAMGPAYAHYAIILLLDPGSEADHCRAGSILAMLETMDNKVSPINPPYVEVRRQLLAAWNAARTQLGQPPFQLNDDQPDVEMQLEPGWTGLCALMRVFHKALEKTTSAAFGVEIWNDIQSGQQTWAELLLAGQADQINVPKGAELRHLLNAAWLARAHPDRDLSMDLTSAVKTLQDKIQQRQEKKGK